MVQVKVTEVVETVEDIDPNAVWAGYAPRKAVKAALFPGGANIGGLHIPGGYYAVVFEDGSIRAVDQETFELVYTPA